MKHEYSDIRQFLDDIHKEINTKEELCNMGILNEENFKGQMTNCVFHSNDHTPSLQVTSSFFKCYACDTKGSDIVSFIQKFYNLDFIDAVKRYAEYKNINISNVQYSTNPLVKKLADEWNKYVNDFNNIPPNAKVTREELDKLAREFYPQEIGYDVDINYIVVPYTSKSGKILGFTKRRIDDTSDVPKWKHSLANNSLISECHNVFNLGPASQPIARIKDVILVEGPKDVIGYRKNKIENVLAVSGTNNVNKIWNVVLPVKGKIIISFDGDAAGVEGSISAILSLVSNKFDIKDIECVVLPDGEDPFSVYKDIEKYYNDRISALEFYVRNAEPEELNELYNALQEYRKSLLVKAICSEKNMSANEAILWISSAGEQSKVKEDKTKMTEKDILLAIVNGDDIPKDAAFVDPDKAKAILSMKYGI